MMETAFFLEVNILSLLILLWMQFKLLTNMDQQAVNIVFRDLMQALILAIIADSAMEIFSGMQGQAAFFFHYIACTATHMLAGLTGTLWFLYTVCEGCGSTKFWLVRRRYIFLLLPAFVDGLLLLSSPFTGIMFSIDPVTNTFSSEPLFTLHLILIYAYYTVAAIRKQVYIVLAWRRHTDGYNLLMEQVFIMFPLVSGVLYIFFPMLPNMWPIISLSLLMVFVESQLQQISLDALTKLNNRRGFDTHIKNALAQRQEGWLIFLFIIDLDLFKKINDTYGHVEGDAALMQAADTLRSVCARRDHNCFLARTGGDEFIIVLKATDPRSAANLRQRIHGAFTKLNKTTKNPYALQVSIGYEQAEDWMSVSDLVAAADRKLYEEKKLHHQQRGSRSTGATAARLP